MAQTVLASLVKRMSSFVPQASSSATEPSSSAEQELHDLEDTMKRIQDVLEDAEEKDIGDKSEQLRLREVTYDAEDAVDEYEYEVLRTKVEARRQAMDSHANDEIAFGARNYYLDRNFLNTGKKIVEMCGGLPLAIKVLASFLSVENEETWIQISDSKLWKLDDEKVGIFPALKLSYDRMPAELKPCFIHLSLFPKDSELKQARIVQQWMAHGFLRTEGKSREEDIATTVSKSYFRGPLFNAILIPVGNL